MWAQRQQMDSPKTMQLSLAEQGGPIVCPYVTPASFIIPLPLPFQAKNGVSYLLLKLHSNSRHLLSPYYVPFTVTTDYGTSSRTLSFKELHIQCKRWTTKIQKGPFRMAIARIPDFRNTDHPHLHPTLGSPRAWCLRNSTWQLHKRSSFASRCKFLLSRYLEAPRAYFKVDDVF